ncbi:MAG: hypothetical protein QXU65_05715 [Sulfolobales archaeon]
MLATVVLALLVFSSVASLAGDVYSKFLELYSRTVELSLRGVETSEVEDLLASAIESIESGDYDRALKLMAEVERCLFVLEREAGPIALTKSLVKYGTAAILLSIPLLVYLLLPRLYIYLWYETRRNWVVVGERPR